MVKYLGSKRRILPLLVDQVVRAPECRTVVDLFSGTARVGHALKARGLRVLANDHNAYAATLARCYVAADRETVEADALRLISEMNALPGRAGYVTATFCEEARFFHPKNGERIDAIREAIARKGLDGELEAVLLTSLLEAADRVDSTTGVQMAYLKSWAPRAHNDLELRMPNVLRRSPFGKSEAHQLDAGEAARRLRGDVVYVDPPYNQHSYLGNYHVWETIVRWDAPEAYGVAKKRVDCRTRRSDFNSKRRIREALAAVFSAIDAPVVIASFNDEGFLSRREMESLLASTLGADHAVRTISIDHPRYVGARIGIHDPSGRKVGRVGRLRNEEYLFIATAPGVELSLAAAVAAE